MGKYRVDSVDFVGGIMDARRPTGEERQMRKWVEARTCLERSKPVMEQTSPGVRKLAVVGDLSGMSQLQILMWVDQGREIVEGLGYEYVDGFICQHQYDTRPEDAIKEADGIILLGDFQADNRANRQVHYALENDKLILGQYKGSQPIST